MDLKTLIFPSTVCNELNGLSSVDAGIGQNDGKCDVDEHIMDVNFSGKTSLTSESRNSSWLAKRFDEELRDNTKMKL
ncbi:unnamed protein product [Prunus armeniaca]|uniref:Uncharacterized protein n=1 Tax=Prunus armeniaca TaxID=36596 RepID=A0A6J5XCJ9_PRUAR|nr:unnamed protein product [Prunus armeniaca]